ncbi:hypothetical protein LK537_07090 [Lachnoclostridium pacaense]|nr:FGGY family carbohydrate kinase [Lachnoclostridium pacaense]MCC2817056.1 hypothetical protein [Lachnoclostridium pacaense]
MNYIGIDLGSSYIKAVLVDAVAHKVVEQAYRDTPPKEMRKNHHTFEISMDKIVDIVFSLINEYTNRYKDIEGIILSAQMHGFVYSLPNQQDYYVSWQDMRCLDLRPGSQQTYLDYMCALIPEEDMICNGVYFKPSLGICNLYARLCEDKDIPRNGTLYTLGSYLIHVMSGRNITHISSAAPIGYLDVKHHSVNEVLLQRLGLDEMGLPELASDDYEICGFYESNGCKLKVYPDYGDMQVAVLGSGIKENDIVVNTATASQVIRYSPEFISGDYEIRPFFKGAYLYTISNMPGGRNLGVLVDFIKEIAKEFSGINLDTQKIWENIHSKKLHVDKELVVSPNFYKNPHFGNGGRIEGITQDNFHIDTVFASALDNMAQTYWHYIQKLGMRSCDIKQIICAGGVNWKTPELCEAIGRVSGKPWRLSPIPDEAIEGILRLALECQEKQEDSLSDERKIKRG